MNGDCSLSFVFCAAECEMILSFYAVAMQRSCNSTRADNDQSSIKVSSKSIYRFSSCASNYSDRHKLPDIYHPW